MNAIQCNHCGHVLVSNDRYDFKWCRCGKVGVDGGSDYKKRSGDPKDYTYLNKESFDKLMAVADIPRLTPIVLPVNNMRKFKIHWLDGKKEVVEGTDIADAFRRTGYGGGSVAAIDYFEEMKKS